MAPSAAKLAHEPGDEKRRVPFAAMLWADADRADLDALRRAACARLPWRRARRRPRTPMYWPSSCVRGPNGPGFVCWASRSISGTSLWTEHDGRKTLGRRGRLPVRDHLDDRRFSHDFKTRVRLQHIERHQSDAPVFRKELPQGCERFGRVLRRRPEGRDVGRKAERQRPALGKPAVAGGERRPDGAIKGAFYRGRSPWRSPNREVRESPFQARRATE